MLDPKKLADQLAQAMRNTIIPAIERCKLNEYPGSSEVGEKMAKDYAKTFDDLVVDDLANLLAGAIDYYVKNANITGMLITNGSPTTHMCNITAAPTPVTGGKIPNTLGIS